MNVVIVFLSAIYVCHCTTSTRSLSLEIVKELYKNQSINHAVFSTSSMRLLYGMALLGAKGDTAKNIEDVLFGSQTEEDIEIEMAKVQETFASKREGVTMKSANLFLVSQKLEVLSGFSNSLENIYNVSVKAVQFKEATIKYLNYFVNKATNGNVKKMFETLEPDTHFMLLSAIYLRTKWSNEFDKSKTQKLDFSNEDGSTSPCEFMSDSRQIYVYTDNEFEIGILPCIGNIELYIYLPRGDVTLEKVLGYFPSHISFLYKFQKRKILFPKIKLTSKNDLKEILSALGMNVPFSDEADFGKMTPEKVHINQSKQTATIEFNEEGTAASAATDVVGLGSSSESLFQVNRPFAFLLFDKNLGDILFAGFVRSLKN